MRPFEGNGRSSESDVRASCAEGAAAVSAAPTMAAAIVLRIRSLHLIGSSSSVNGADREYHFGYDVLAGGIVSGKNPLAVRLASSTMSPEHPQAIGVGQDLGPYRIEALLGAGGMGVVYRARDRKLQRIVAIKVVDRRRVDATRAAGCCRRRASRRRSAIRRSAAF